MPKKYITSLTGGLNEVTRPDMLNDNEVQECVNYEISGAGILQKRTEPTTYDSSLDALLKDLYDTQQSGDSNAIGQVLFMSPPYYPPTKPSDMVGDFMLLFYGTPTPGNTGYAYYLTYLSDRGGPHVWTHTDEQNRDLLEPIKEGRLGLVFNQHNEPSVSIGENGILLTDNINPPLNIYVDSLNNVMAEKFTLNAPKNKPVIEIPQAAATDGDYPEMIYTEFLSQDSSLPYVCEPGLIQVVYTVITKDGEESNPSPISSTADFQYLRIDSEGNTDQFIKKLNITNLALPNVSADMKTKIEKFNVYMRVMKYTSSHIPQDFQFIESFRVVDKDNVTGETQNSYTITNKLGDGEFVSYENDGSPVVKFSEQVAGVSFLGNVTDKALLPYNFDNVIPITIENKNNDNYVDYPLDLRIYDKNASEVTLSHKKINTLDWGDYLTGDDEGSPALAKRMIPVSELNKFRIFHVDRTTPCMVLYMSYDDNKNYIDLRVVIPYLVKGFNTLYFGFDGDGVVQEDYHNLDYGQFILSSGYGGGAVFDPSLMPQSKYFFKYTPLLDEDVLLATDTTRKGPKLNPPDFNCRNGAGWNTWNGSPHTMEFEANKTTQSIINKANMRFSAPWEAQRWDPQSSMYEEGFESDVAMPKYFNAFQGDRLVGAVNAPYVNVQKGGVTKWPGNTAYGDLGIGSGLANQTFSVWGTISYQADVFQQLRPEYWTEGSSGGFSQSFHPTGHQILYNFSMTGVGTGFTEFNDAIPTMVHTGMSLSVHNGMPEGQWHDGIPSTPPIVGQSDLEWGFTGTQNNGLALILYSDSASAWSFGQTSKTWLWAYDYNPAQASDYIDVWGVPSPHHKRVIATHFGPDFPLQFGRGNTSRIHKYFVGVSINDENGDVSIWMSDISGAFCDSDANIHGARQGQIYHQIKRGAYSAPWLDKFGGFGQFTTGGGGYGRLTNYENNELPGQEAYSSYYPWQMRNRGYGPDVTGGAYGTGGGSYLQTSYLGAGATRFTGTTFKLDEFFATDDDDALNRLYSVQTGSYPTPQPIGRRYVPFPTQGDTSVALVNQNIAFELPVVSGKKFENMVKWSNLYSFGFPELNYLLVGEPIRAMIKAPSFLKFEYDNTLIIFTRNNVYRFILSGTPDAWKGRVDNLIEEFTEYGLYAPKSLVRAGEALFWMSERGIIKWDANGLRVISDERINVELNEDSVGYYNPVNNQYIINYK